jgi:hypothetical protein
MVVDWALLLTCFVGPGFDSATTSSFTILPSSLLTDHPLYNLKY